MQTVHSDLTHETGVVPFVNIPDESHVYSEDNEAYASVGVMGLQHLNVEGVKMAGLFASTTSYLSKAKFSFNHNEFVVSKENVKIKECVVPCCADPGTDGCSCDDMCPSEEIDVVPGTFKYSIMAAAFDMAGETGYVSGAAGNGWQAVRAAHGTGPNKTLKGELHVYQVIDFTNMKADTLLVTAPDGTEVKYKDMAVCSDPENETACPVHLVGSMTVQADGWSGEYAFPLTYNVGTWTTEDFSSMNATNKATRKVKIHCIKPSAALMTLVGLAEDATAAASQKVVFLDYVFNIDGIDAEALSGTYMVYDPNVNSKAGTSGGGSDDPTGGTTGPGGVGAASLAATLPLPWRACTCVVAFLGFIGV